MRLRKGSDDNGYDPEIFNHLTPLTEKTDRLLRRRLEPCSTLCKDGLLSLDQLVFIQVRPSPLPLQLLLLLFRHSAKSLNAQEGCMATSPLIDDKAPPATRDSSEVARA